MFASLGLPDPVATMPRPPAEDSDAQVRALEAWKARHLWGVPVAVIAARCGVRRETVWRWIAAADRYPEAAALRRVMGGSRAHQPDR